MKSSSAELESLSDRFEKMVRMGPDRSAVKAGDRCFTYDQLNRKANRIARAILERRGPGSELVALQFEHGVDVVAAIFGALKAGKSCVALDPSLPHERTAYIVADSQARLIVTNDRNAEGARLLVRGAGAWLNIDDIGESLSSDDVGVAPSPDDPAIMTYTSGSTGAPKGVVRPHRSFLHSAAKNAEEIRIGRDDRLSLCHSLSFSSGYRHFFSSLLYGAALFPFDIKSEGPHGLVSWLMEEQITICHLPLAVFRQVAGSLSGRDLSRLRMLNLSGAPMSREDFELYKSTLPAATRLTVSMGSTETGGICFAVLDQSFSFPPEGSPVGYPSAAKEVFLLDETGKKVAPGEIGEIAVRDRNLNSGYWNNPELTGARFVPDPDGGHKSIHLTGDLGRMMPDGFVIHLGRKDFMVKIRGYRVELPEIEKALLAHPRIEQAAVIAWDRDGGEKYPAAYVVSRDQPPPTVSELREFLRATLPDYMLPARFKFLAALPLTNGKLDRAALPPPDHARPDLAAPYAAPEDEVQKMLVRVWEEILNVRPIGIDDTFFELGGHSLLAAKLFARLDDEFGRLLPLGVLAAAPTGRLLAERYRASAAPEKMSPLVPLTATGGLPPVYAVPGVFGNVIGLADLCRELGPGQPFYGLQSIGLDGGEAPLDSVEEMAELYLHEIRALQSRGPYVLLGVCFGARVAYEMARLLADGGEEAAFLGLLDPIGLEKNETGENTPSPWTLFPRARAVGAFVTERVRLYAQEMRELEHGNRLRFIVKKIRAVGHRFGDSKALRTVRREMHQLAVYKASKRAGERFHPKPIHGRLRVVEIFDTASGRNNPGRRYVDWNALWKGRIKRHLMPGKDSGDMVSGENARVLARLLKERMHAAFEIRSDKEAL
ncbi:MAG: AMP-binding protein [Candidatus Binatia bacterium]